LFKKSARLLGRDTRPSCNQNTFDGGIDTLSVDRYVLSSARFLARENAAKTRRGIESSALIIEGNEGTTVTADSYCFRSRRCRAQRTTATTASAAQSKHPDGINKRLLSPRIPLDEARGFGRSPPGSRTIPSSRSGS
jgi:hypothetical protein